jgi:hypothetical protein
MVSPNLAAAAASYSRPGQRRSCGRPIAGGCSGPHVGLAHPLEISGGSGRSSTGLGEWQSPCLQVASLSATTTVQDHPTVHFTLVVTTKLGRGGAAHSHTGNYSPPLPARSLKFGETPASVGNLVSSLSQSQSSRSARRCPTGDAENSTHRRPARRKKDADDPKDDEDDDTILGSQVVSGLLRPLTTY